MTYPKFIQLYPTLKCNQACTFCFNQNVARSESQIEMSEKDAFSLVDRLMGANIMELDILGGEPTLLPWLEHFLRYCCSAGMTVNISTNGTRSEAISAIAAIPCESLNIGFSLHGFSNSHRALTGSTFFDSVIEGIASVLRGGKSPIVKSVLTSANREDISRLVTYIAERGVKRYYLLHEDTIGREHPEDALSFPQFWRVYEQLRAESKDFLEIGYVAASGFVQSGESEKKRCKAGSEKLAVLPDGSVFPCNLLIRFEEFCLGNILQSSIDDILRHPVLEHFKRFSGKPCRFSACRHFDTCTGGCPAHSYYYYRNITRPDPRCRSENVNGFMPSVSRAREIC